MCFHFLTIIIGQFLFENIFFVVEFINVIIWRFNDFKISFWFEKHFSFRANKICVYDLQIRITSTLNLDYKVNFINFSLKIGVFFTDIKGSWVYNLLLEEVEVNVNTTGTTYLAWSFPHQQWIWAIWCNLIDVKHYLMQKHVLLYDSKMHRFFSRIAWSTKRGVALYKLLIDLWCLTIQASIGLSQIFCGLQKGVWWWCNIPNKMKNDEAFCRYTEELFLQNSVLYIEICKYSPARVVLFEKQTNIIIEWECFIQKVSYSEQKIVLRQS